MCIFRNVSRNRIEELRKASGLTQRELGERVGVNASTVSRWEHDQQAIPDPTKQHLAEIFGVSVPWLMGWTDGNGDGERQIA